MKKNKPKPAKQVKNRDKKGRFVKGESGNPNGRPPAGWSWAELLRDMGEEIMEKGSEKGKPFKKVVSKRLWFECMKGNVSAIRELFNRMEGLPKQKTELEGAVNIYFHESLKQK